MVWDAKSREDQKARDGEEEIRWATLNGSIFDVVHQILESLQVGFGRLCSSGVVALKPSASGV